MKPLEVQLMQLDEQRTLAYDNLNALTDAYFFFLRENERVAERSTSRPS